jgi:16S rRNA (guanine527-N7)-methyltransferase
MPDSAEFIRTLQREYGAVGLVSDSEAARLFAHYELLLRWNRVLNLTRIEDLAEAVTRHYCESLFLADRLPPGTWSILDFGSGAGFPGIPIAVRRPDCRLTLAESHVRKSVFLREATRDLPNVTVSTRRAEDSGEDVVRADGRGVALLLGKEDAERAVGDRRFAWEPIQPLPWGARRVLLIGQRV